MYYLRIMPWLKAFHFNFFPFLYLLFKKELLAKLAYLNTSLSDMPDFRLDYILWPSAKFLGNVVEKRMLADL